MLGKWLRSSILFVCIVSASTVFSQKTDTLKTFEKSEVLSPLRSFSYIDMSLDYNDLSSLDEWMEQHSPVYLKNYGQGQLATLSVRGNGASQTQLFWNGFKMNSPTLGQTDLSLIPSFFITSATLNYSGGSSVNGSGGIGGSLDLANKLQWRNGIHAIYGKKIGSFTNSTSTLSLSFGGKKMFHQLKLLTKKGVNNFGFQDISKKSKSIVSQENNSVFQYGLQYELGAKLNNKNLIQGTILFFNSQRELPPIIGAVSNQEVQEDENIKSFLTWKSFQKKFSTDFRVSYFKEKLNYEDLVSSIFSEVDINTYQAQIRASFNLFSSLHLEISIQNSLSQAISSGFSEDQKRNETGAYFKISQELKKGYYELFARQELVDNDLSPLVFGGGLIYNPFKNSIRFKGNLSSNYRVPTLNDLYWARGGNQDLLPEKGWTAEVGVDFKNSSKKAKKSRSYRTESVYSLTGFFNQTKNWIQWAPTDFGYWSPINVKEIENKGIEAQIYYQYKRSNYKTEARLFYTYTHSRNKQFEIENDERENRIPIYVPTHKANAFLSFSRNGFSLSYSQIYNSKVFIDESNSIYLPHYFPANIGFSYKKRFKKISYIIGGKINNVYNEPYQVVANRPVPGRNYSLFLTLQL